MAIQFGSIVDRQLRTAAGRGDSRRKLMGAVHAAAKAQGLDADTRHAMQLRVTGLASLTDMNAHQLGLVLDHLNKNGSRTRAKPHVGKIRALWWTLYWIGKVDSGSEASLDRFIERQTGKAKIAFLDARNAHQVIEALKSWTARDEALVNGRAPPRITWPTATDLAKQQGYRPDANIDMPKLERITVIDALADALDRLGLVSKHAIDRYIASAVPGKAGCINVYYWTNTELDAAIRVLGKKLRRALDKDRRASDNGTDDNREPYRP